MDNKSSFEQLLQKPVAMMTGEELTSLFQYFWQTQDNGAHEAKPKRMVYGINGIAEIFGCSVPTANRIKASGIIDGAITQVGRKIVVDGDMALQLAHAAGGINV